MSTYTLYNAKIHLSQLIEQACAGEEMIIAKGKTPLVKLASWSAAKPQRRFGAIREQAVVSDAFFEPLPSDKLNAWSQ